MTVTLPSWETLRAWHARARTTDLSAMAEEARAIEETVASLEDQVRRGEDVQPGRVEAAEARGRHVRLRLDGVVQQHDRVLAEAHAGWARQVHDAAADLDDAFVFDAVKSVTRAIARLSRAVPDWNQQLMVVLEASREVSPATGVDVGVVHGGLRVDGRTKLPVTFEQLLHQAIYDGVEGNPDLVGDGELWGKATRAHTERMNLKDRAQRGI